MAGFVFGCLTPHGSQIIEKLSVSAPQLMEKTRDSMVQLGKRMAESRPDVIMVLTPHGLRIEGQFSVTDCEHTYGELEDDGGIVRMDRKVDRALAAEVVAAAKAQELPIAQVNYATSEGPMSCLPMDWGVLVPLHFMPEVPVVVVTPTRSLSFADHVRLGEALALAAEKSGKRVGLIASCDWSHAHDEKGPYGYHPDAAALDAQVVKLLEENRLEALTEFDADFIENAKPDGIWQALILAGAMPPSNRQVEVLSYEVPTYFGLLCASVNVN